MADPFVTPTFDGSNYDTIQLLREHIQSKYPTVFPQIEDHLRIFHLNYFGFTDIQAMSVLTNLSSTKTGRSFQPLKFGLWLVVDSIFQPLFFTSLSKSLQNKRSKKRPV